MALGQKPDNGPVVEILDHRQFLGDGALEVPAADWTFMLGTSTASVNLASASTGVSPSDGSLCSSATISTPT